MNLLLGSSAFIFSVSVAITLTKLNFVLGTVKSWVQFIDDHLQMPFEAVRSLYRYLEKLK
jgi:hypothetical protein